MRLVLEDDSGAAWYVTEEAESIDLTSIEGKEYILREIANTIQQMKEETVELNMLEEENPEGDPEMECEIKAALNEISAENEEEEEEEDES